MEKVVCPYCGKLTDKVICPQCRAEIPRDDKPAEEKPAPVTVSKQTRKNQGGKRV